ncbi:hypothetical protein AWB79_03185 [Caballeronia hypogeia]|uniref:Uncharacterized protein n=1 Tax=Caballeronia hypogeia TaxID=1777140 RepID=A0A158B4S8_9BURK|nr:hypothetical protein AWB79_03185 [Caballeronia hypogeia]
MDAFYLYLELVALAVLVWLCRDKLRPVVAKNEAPRAALVTVSRSRKFGVPAQSPRLRRNRSSWAR